MSDSVARPPPAFSIAINSARQWLIQVKIRSLCELLKLTINQREAIIVNQYKGTTIVAARRGTCVAIGGDGQVSLGESILKGNARKVRRLYHERVIAGFAGGTADAFTLFERFEAKLEKHQGHLTRAAVELAKDWRTDRMLRRLEALLLIADAKTTLVISGNGDVVEPEYPVMAIGSGGGFALAAGRALVSETTLEAPEIVTRSLAIAADICIYTNQNVTIEELDSTPD